MSAERLPAGPLAARAVPGDLQAVLDRKVASLVAEARRAGAEALRAECAASLRAGLDAAAAGFERAREAALEELAHDAVRLGLSIARRILRRELPAGGYDLELIVREALACAGTGRGPCVVHLNPADAERLAGASFRSNTRIAADSALALGDVHVETPQGLLVRDVDLILEHVEARLFEALAE